MLRTRRLVAGSTVLLLVLAAAAPAVAACAGWSMSSRDRHACCAHLGDLASEASVNDCCATSEQSGAPSDREYQLTTVLMRPLPVVGIVLDALPEPAPPVFDRVSVPATSPPKYILLASFLI